MFCFNNVFYYAPLDLNYLFVRLLRKILLFRYIQYFLLYHMWLYYSLLYCKFYIFQTQVIVKYFSVIHLYSVAFVSYVWNAPYFFVLVMHFTILHFYWIEFVAAMLWKDIIFSKMQLIISFYYQVLLYFWFVVLCFSQTLLNGFITSL